MKPSKTSERKLKKVKLATEMHISSLAVLFLGFNLNSIMANGSSPSQIKGNRTVYIGVMAPESKWWGEGIPIAMEIAIEAVNNRSDILAGYHLKLLKRDTKGDTGLGNKVFFDFVTERKVILMLGPSRSNVAESVGASAKYYNVIQISPSASSGKLSDKRYYPYFFRTLPALSSAAKTFVRIAQHFNWKRVAILYYSRELFAGAAEALHDECLANNITVISYGSYFEDSASSQIKHLKQLDARIIFAFLQKITGVMCEIYKQSMNTNRHAWVINTADSHPWWNRTFSSVTCTPDEVYEGAKGIISVDYSFISQNKETSKSGLTPQGFLKLFQGRIYSLGLRDTPYKGFAYDAALLAALGLNSSLGELPPNMTLDRVHLDHSGFTQLLQKHLLETSFMSVTIIYRDYHCHMFQFNNVLTDLFFFFELHHFGPFSLALQGQVALDEKGDRYGIYDILQLQGNKLVPIYNHETAADNFLQYEGREFIWKGGRPPADSLVQQVRTVKLSLAILVFMCCLSASGVVLSLAFLQINILKRHRRVIKMSSPNLNNVIILGCMLSYTSLVLYAMDGELLTSIICRARAICLSCGFTLAFGAIFSKTWRVHRITRLIAIRKKFIKDVHLLCIVGGLLLVDAIIWIIWTMLDPLTKSVRYQGTEIAPENNNVIVVLQVHYCATNNKQLWTGLLCGYKGILLLFGLFLAWETRNVKIPALNDSQHIGMAVYNIVIVCLVGVPTVLFFSSRQHNTSFIITAICISSCTTTTLLLVFIPKISALRQSSIEVCKSRSLSTYNSVYGCDFKKNLSESSPNVNQGDELKKLKEMLKTLQLEQERKNTFVAETKF